MIGPYRKSRSSPLHALDRVKADIASEAFRFGSSVIGKLRSDVGNWSDKKCRAQVRKLVRALNEDDFFCNETFRFRATGRVINCDVYGKKDELGVWYIKFAVLNDNTCLFSCHLAENDMELKSGKILRVQR